jgi:hypothetical protein
LKLSENYPKITNYSDPELLKETFLSSEEDSDDEEEERKEKENETDHSHDMEQSHDFPMDEADSHRPQPHQLYLDKMGNLNSSLFLSLLNKIISRLNQCLQGKLVAAEELMIIQQISLDFLFASSEFIALIYENKFLYLHYFHFNKDTMLKYPMFVDLHLFLSDLLVYVAFQFIEGQNTTLDNFLGYLQNHVLSYHFTEGNEGFFERFKSLLLESCVAILLNTISSEGNANIMFKIPQLSEKAETFLFVLLNHKSAETIDNSTELRKLWNSFFYFEFVFRFLPSNKTEENSKKKKNSRRPLHDYFKHADVSIFTELIDQVNLKLVESERIFKKLNLGESGVQSEGEADQQLKPHLLLFLPHLTDLHFQIVSLQSFHSLGKKLIDFVISQKEKFLKDLNRGNAQSSSPAPTSGNYNNRMTQMNEVDLLIQEYSSQSSKSKRKSSETAFKLGKVLLSNLEMDESYEENYLVQCFQSISKDLRKCLKRGTTISTSSAGSTPELQKKWNELIYLQLTSVEEFLFYFQKVKKEQDNASESVQEGLLCDDDAVYCYLGQYLDFISDSLTKMTSLKGFSLDSEQIQQNFVVITSILTMLAHFSTTNTEKVSSKIKFMISFSQQLKQVCCGLITGFRKPMDEQLLRSNFMNNFINKCLYLWFTKGICTVESSQEESTLSSAPSLVNYPLILSLSHFLRFYFCERNFPAEKEIEEDFYPFNDPDLMISICLSCLTTMKSCSATLASTFPYQRELFTNCSLIFCSLISAQPTIRSLLDSQKPPTINRMEIYQLSVNYLLQNLSFLFPYVEGIPLPSIKSKAERRLKHKEEKEKKLILKSYENLLSPIVYPLIYHPEIPSLFTTTMQRICCSTLGKLFHYLYVFPFPLIYEKNFIANEETIRTDERNVMPEEDEEEELEQLKDVFTQELVLHLYYFANYCFDYLELIARNNIREIYFWILCTAKQFSGSKETMNKIPFINSNYFFSSQSHLITEGTAIQSKHGNFFENVIDVYSTCSISFINELSAAYSRRTLQSKFSFVNMKENIFADLYQFGLPTIEDKTVLAFLSGDYYLNYELKKFYLLLQDHPFLKLIQDPVKLFKDDENEEDKKKKKKKKASNVKSNSNRAPLSNNNLLMEIEGDEALKVTPDTTEDEAEQDYDNRYFDEQENSVDSPPPVLEYSLVIEETNLFYLFLLQNDLSSFPFVTSSDSINSYREDLFTPLNNLMNHFIGIREKLNNIMHERCFYDQTKEYFSEKRKLFFQSHPTNAAKFDYFQVITTLLAKNSNQTSELFDHDNNLCYFWIFHSYFLDLIFVPYVESFYSFLDNDLIIDSANQQSASTPTFSSSLENWFIQSKAKEVYFQQLIEKRPIVGTSSAAPDISTAMITFPDNIQFIKSLLLVDYFIVVIEEFLFKIFAILSVLFQQSQSQRLLTVDQENSTLTGRISTEMEVDNMEGVHNSATQEEKSDETVTPENNIYFLHEFGLVMINFLNNFTKYPSEPNVLLEDEQEHRNYGQRRIELKEFIFSLLKKGKKYFCPFEMELLFNVWYC